MDNTIERKVVVQLIETTLDVDLKGALRVCVSPYTVTYCVNRWAMRERADASSFLDPDETFEKLQKAFDGIDFRIARTNGWDLYERKAKTWDFKLTRIDRAAESAARIQDEQNQALYIAERTRIADLWAGVSWGPNRSQTWIEVADCHDWRNFVHMMPYNPVVYSLDGSPLYVLSAKPAREAERKGWIDLFCSTVGPDEKPDCMVSRFENDRIALVESKPLAKLAKYSVTDFDEMTIEFGFYVEHVSQLRRGEQRPSYFDFETCMEIDLRRTNDYVSDGNGDYHRKESTKLEVSTKHSGSQSVEFIDKWIAVQRIALDVAKQLQLIENERAKALEN